MKKRIKIDWGHVVNTGANAFIGAFFSSLGGYAMNLTIKAIHNNKKEEKQIGFNLKGE